MAAVDLPAPRPPGAGPGPGIAVLDIGGGCTLQVLDAGLACCAVEVAAALRRWRAPAPGPAAVRTIFVVAGTVTDKLAPFVLAAYRQTPGPRRVLSFGACASSGGPYWDSYCVTKGVDQFVPVDMYVPGCPPRPEALLAAVRLLMDQEPAQ